MYPWSDAPLFAYLAWLKFTGRIPVILFLCCCLSGCVSGRVMSGVSMSVECSIDTDDFRTECSKEHLGVKLTRQF